MPCPFPLLWPCLLPLLSRFQCQFCALGQFQCQAIAEAVPMVNLNAQIHTFAKYNLQIPNTNAMSISIAMAVPVAMAEPFPRLFPWPMLMPSHCQRCAHGQFQYTDSFILLLNTTYKCLIPMLCLLLLPSWCRCCALGQCWCRAIAKAVPMVNLNTQIHSYFC